MDILGQTGSHLFTDTWLGQTLVFLTDAFQILLLPALLTSHGLVLSFRASTLPLLRLNPPPPPPPSLARTGHQVKAEDSIEPEDWELVSPGARQMRQVRGKVIGLYGGLCRYSAHVPPEDTVATQYSV